MALTPDLGIEVPVYLSFVEPFPCRSLIMPITDDQWKYMQSAKTAVPCHLGAQAFEAFQPINAIAPVEDER